MLDALAGATIIIRAAGKIHDTNPAEYLRLRTAFRAVSRLALARSRFLWQIVDGEIDAEVLLPHDLEWGAVDPHGCADVPLTRAELSAAARRQRKSSHTNPRVSVQGT